MLSEQNYKEVAYINEKNDDTNQVTIISYLLSITLSYLKKILNFNIKSVRSIECCARSVN